MTNNNQSTALATRDNVALPVQSFSDLAEFGKLLAQSGIAGVSNPAEGFVVATHLFQKNMSIVEFMETYHVFHGRVSKRADAILADLIRFGGNYKIVDRSPDRAAIEITTVNNDKTELFTFTWQEALNEPFIYRGGPKLQAAELKKPINDRQLKDKYQTPRSRMQMLWARVVSDGCRAMDPRTCQGMYPPEVVADFDNDNVIEGDYTTKSDPEPIEIPQTQIQTQQSDSVVIQQTQQPPQNAPNSDPFEKQIQTPDVDYNLCPLPFNGAENVPWVDMDLNSLNQAARIVDHPAMQPGHYEAIQAAINSKVKG